MRKITTVFMLFILYMALILFPSCDSLMQESELTELNGYSDDSRFIHSSLMQESDISELADSSDESPILENDLSGNEEVPQNHYLNKKFCIDDEEKVNVSPKAWFDAFESVTQPDVIYIEAGIFGWGPWLDDGLPTAYLNKIIPHDFLMTPIIQAAEEAFQNKTIVYHVIFDNSGVPYIIGKTGALTDETRSTLRDRELSKIYDLLHTEIEYEETDSGEPRVKSPELFATKDQLDEICNSGIGCLFYRCSTPSIEYLEEYHLDYVNSEEGQDLLKRWGIIA